MSIAEAEPGKPRFASAGDALREYCEAFAACSAERAAAAFHDRALCEIPLIPGRLWGRDAIREALEPILADFESCEVKVGAVGERDGVAIGEGRLRAKTGDGQELAFPFAAVVELDDGLIARLTEYFDTDPLLPLDN
jgi:ketosteroid isomerase-like protein